MLNVHAQGIHWGQYASSYFLKTRLYCRTYTVITLHGHKEGTDENEWETMWIYWHVRAWDKYDMNMDWLI